MELISEVSDTQIMKKPVHSTQQLSRTDSLNVSDIRLQSFQSLRLTPADAKLAARELEVEKYLQDSTAFLARVNAHLAGMLCLPNKEMMANKLYQQRIDIESGYRAKIQQAPTHLFASTRRQFIEDLKQFPFHCQEEYIPVLPAMLADLKGVQFREDVQEVAVTKYPPLPLFDAIKGQIESKRKEQAETSSHGQFEMLAGLITWFVIAPVRYQDDDQARSFEMRVCNLLPDGKTEIQIDTAQEMHDFLVKTYNHFVKLYVEQKRLENKFVMRINQLNQIFIALNQCNNLDHDVKTQLLNILLNQGVLLICFEEYDRELMRKIRDEEMKFSQKIQQDIRATVHDPGEFARRNTFEFQYQQALEKARGLLALNRVIQSYVVLRERWK